ncbi:hypothetical protein FF2_022286 [Malus domestica]
MESLESFDELLDFPSDVGEEDKDEDFEASNALPGDDPSCQFSETEECSEEVLEWLSNKDAFPPVETFFGIDLSFAGIPWEGEQLSTNQSDNSGKDDMTKAETPMMAKTVGRQCHHCGTRKTSRWQAGPLGPKTLCNACWCWYKSGRLFPEYRPASLTSFASKLQPKPPRKKKKIQNIETGIGGEAEIRVRKCQQCETEATPKWRSGPLGLETLCNACWHRYEISKKLVTQCCPASSHTFSKKLRSNRHRKLSNVLRKKQEMETGDFPASSPTFPKKLRSNRHQKLSDILRKKQEMEISVEACV